MLWGTNRVVPVFVPDRQCQTAYDLKDFFTGTKTMYHPALSEPSPHGATALAITSGKGGVGKTNIAANLAICLASLHRRVVLMDADLGLGNLDVVLNIQSRYNLSHVISGRRELDQIIHVGPLGVEVICGGSGIEMLANLNTFQRQRLLDGLDKLHHRADFLIIDTGAGIQSNVVGFCLASEQTIVVTTPEPTAMTDAYAMIKVLAANGYAGRVNVLVNMTRSVSEGRMIYRQIADVASRFLDFPVYDAGVLCKDDSVLNAVRKRMPTVLAYPNSPFAASLNDIGTRLAHGICPSRRNPGFFRKVVNWFF